MQCHTKSTWLFSISGLDLEAICPLLYATDSDKHPAEAQPNPASTSHELITELSPVPYLFHSKQLMCLTGMLRAGTTQNRTIQHRVGISMWSIWVTPGTQDCPWWWPLTAHGVGHNHIATPHSSSQAGDACCGAVPAVPHLGWLLGKHSSVSTHTHRLDLRISIKQEIPISHAVTSWLYMLPSEWPLSNYPKRAGDRNFNLSASGHLPLPSDVHFGLFCRPQMDLKNKSESEGNTFQKR